FMMFIFFFNLSRVRTQASTPVANEFITNCENDLNITCETVKYSDRVCCKFPYLKAEESMDLIAYQSKFLEFERGLFLIKYESAEDKVNPPRVLISPQPSNTDAIELILPPDAPTAVLWSPGACMVLHATKSGRVEVSVAPALPNGSQAARIQLVPLSADP